MKWSPTDGFAGRVKGAVGTVARGVEAKLDAKVMAWQQSSDQSAYGTYGNNPPAAGTGKPPASAGSGRNKPLSKRPQRQGGNKPGSDEELTQFREWQSSQSQWSGLGTGRVWRGYEALGGIGVDSDRSQYKFHDIHPRTGWGSGRAVRSENVNEDAGEDTRSSTVEGGTVDMTPKDDDDWSASEETFNFSDPALSQPPQEGEYQAPKGLGRGK